MLTPEENRSSPETENNENQQTTPSSADNPYIQQNTAENRDTENQAGEDGGKKCPHCGAIVREDARFCVKCGKTLEADYHTATAGGAAVPPSQAEYTAQPAYTGVPEKLGVFDYLLMIIGFNIPLLGLILQLYWSFSSTTAINRRNLSRAFLILRVIQYVLVILYVVIIFAVAGGVVQSFTENNYSSLF